jgi:PleD family two-component response regulator
LTGLPGEVRLTVSIGVAASHPFDMPQELLRRCDEALYRSKRSGRNLVTVDRSAPADVIGAAQASA